MIAIILGPDHYLARQAALQRARAADPAGENTSWLDARETSLEAMMAAVGAVSLFGGNRVVVVSDLLGRSRRDGSAGEGEAGGERQARSDQGLVRLCQSVADTNDLILLEPALISPPAAIRKVTPPVEVIKAEPPRGPALIAWVQASAAEANSSIDRAAAQHLVATLYPQTWSKAASNPRYDRPPDMGRLAQEIAKLAIAAHPDPISIETVHDFVASGPDQRVFRFLDAAMAADLATAMTELDRLDAAGEEPGMVLAQLLGQAELLAVAAAAGHRDADAVARDLGLSSPARISAALNAQRRHTGRRTHVQIATSIDRRLKSGRIRHPRGAIDAFLTESATGQ